MVTMKTCCEIYARQHGKFYRKRMASQLILSRLLQLASPMLPVGAYSYSQGLEWAIECKAVHDHNSVSHWIGDALNTYQLHFELPLLSRLWQAWDSHHMQAVEQWDTFYQAGRDTAEALAETRQMGYSLCRLIHALDDLPAVLKRQLDSLNQPAFPTVYAALANHWQIPVAEAMHGYIWGWLENQVSAAMKTVPLGQVAGQTILLQLGQVLPSVVESAIQIQDDEISNFNPLLSIAGARHETQYSRLFRS